MLSEHELTEADSLAKQIARRTPSTWREACQIYFEYRKAGFKRDLENASTFDQDGICDKLGGVKLVQAAIAVIEFPASPEHAYLPGEADEDDKNVFLGAVLAPRGWERSISPILNELQEQYLENAVDFGRGSDERRKVVAAASEIERLHAMLSAVRSAAEQSIVRQQARDFGVPARKVANG